MEESSVGERRIRSLPVEQTLNFLSSGSLPCTSGTYSHHIMPSDRWNWPRTVSDQYKYMKQLRLPARHITANRSALGRVVHVCHHVVTDYNVRCVTTCGSVGKGTAMNKSADLDLVVFLECIKRHQMSNEFPALLDAIQEAMDSQYPGTRDVNWYRKFGLRYNIAGMEIDVLIAAPDVHPRDFLEVSDPEQRSYMSASVSHLATRFMKKQSLLFKDLVRVAKDWRDSFSWAAHCKPKSYLLEVIMLDACRHFKSVWSSKKEATHWNANYYISTLVLLKFFDLIGSVDKYNPNQKYDESHLPKLFVCFETYYSRDEVPLDSPEPIFEWNRVIGKGRKARIKTRKATAIVLDPVNPTNNLWLTLGDAQALVSRARTTAAEIRATM